MKIEQVRVSNYRTLEDVVVNFDGYYSAISGQNNAGKTSLMKVIRDIFRDNTKQYFAFRDNDDITYSEDKTQWNKNDDDIVFTYVVGVSKVIDPGLFIFIEKFYEKEIGTEKLSLKVVVSYDKEGVRHCKVFVGDDELKSFDSNEVLKKLLSSNLAFMHNSAENELGVIASRGRMFHEMMFSDSEKDQLAAEQKKIRTKIQKIAKNHKTELSELLGHLEDKYEVEFTIPEGYFSRTMPFGINLKDKNVEVPLNDWGSGTRNRTQIMVSILQANRIGSNELDENRITPIVLIEEPESFLHPSAQAEFGRVLRDLANELKIQTIVTTHSPYMLCQTNFKSNILLDRKIIRRKLMSTEVIDLSEDDWMHPFSEILGLDNAEFEPWRKVLDQDSDYVFLVEGILDKEYIEHINSLGLVGYSIPTEIDIVPYDGKDALKNTVLLKFVLGKFKNTLISFDLDAKNEIVKTMNQLSLKESEDYFVVGINKPGKECVEGLIPERIVSQVYATNSDLVMQLTAQDGKLRKSAKSSLKSKILTEFKSKTDYSEEELKPFKTLFSFINNRYSHKKC
jgi:putative ATP-dependent endonuclease of OLD family